MVLRILPVLLLTLILSDVYLYFKFMYGRRHPLWAYFLFFPAQRIVADCRPHIDLDGKPYAGEHDPNGHLLQSLHAHCATQDAVPYRGFDRKRHLPVFPRAKRHVRW